jgi:hypothetical protein
MLQRDKKSDMEAVEYKKLTRDEEGRKPLISATV